MAVDVDEAGDHELPAGVDDAPSLCVAQSADGDDAIAPDAHVGVVPRVTRSVDYAAAFYQDIERRILGRCWSGERQKAEGEYNRLQDRSLHGTHSNFSVMGR
jgi:hypothetical protein